MGGEDFAFKVLAADDGSVDATVEEWMGGEDFAFKVLAADDGGVGRG
jgi:hypothetical protein